MSAAHGQQENEVMELVGCTPQLGSRSGKRVDQVPDEWLTHLGLALPETGP